MIFTVMLGHLIFNMYLIFKYPSNLFHYFYNQDNRPYIIQKKGKIRKTKWDKRQSSFDAPVSVGLLSPGIVISRGYGLLEELELVEVEHNEVASAEDTHENAQAAED